MSESKKTTNGKLDSILKKFHKTANDWAKKSVAGTGRIEIVKMPDNKTRIGGISVAYNSKKTGFQSKKDKYFRTVGQFKDHMENIIADAETMVKLLKVVEKVNGTVSSPTQDEDDDALVI